MEFFELSELTERSVAVNLKYREEAPYLYLPPVLLFSPDTPHWKIYGHRGLIAGF